MSLEVRLALRRGDFQLDVGLDLPAHGVTSVYGPSGGGKTTLLRAIAGLEPRAQGSVRIGEITWQDRQVFVPAHRRRIGFVFQESGLFPHLDVARNVTFGLPRHPEHRPGLDQAVALLGIGDLMSRFPASLSGGERKRVAIARALARKPSILLLDEPMNGLDRQRSLELLPFLDQLHERLEIPIVHVTHSLTELQQLADHVVLLDEGRVTASGAAAEILTRPDLAPARDAQAAALVDARVSDIDHEFALVSLEFSGGVFRVPAPSVSRGAPIRLSIAARDVSITRKLPVESSILNIFPARIVSVQVLSDALALVALDVSGTTLLSRVTRKSVTDLGLQPGLEVYAQVKSVALS